jgi:hypothetical protein
LPQYTPQNLTYGTAFLNAIIAALKVAPTNPLVNTAKVRLSANPSYNPTPTSTITALASEEANYSGYTAGGLALTVGSPVNLSSTCQGAVTALQFLATTATPFVANQIYGYWVDDGTNVLVAEKFAAGLVVAFGAPGDYLELLVTFAQQAYCATF